MSTAAAPARPPSRWDAFRLHLLDNRYPSLHGLRVLAIVSVVQYHVTWIMIGEQGIVLDPTFTDLSLGVFFGMDLFFILSGFLIGSILIRSLEIEGTRDLRRFYLRRAFRTFPAYYVVLTVLVLAFGLTPGQRQDLWGEYTYLTNFMPLLRDKIVMFWGWSLALEEQFYLTVPLFLLVLSKLRSNKARAALLIAVWLSALAIREWYYYRHSPLTDLQLYDQVYFRTKTRFDTLVAGIFLAFLQHTWREPIGAWLQRPFHRALIALPTLGCLWLLLEPAMFGDAYVQRVHLLLWGTVTSLFYLGTLLLLLHGHGAIQRALSAPIFRRIATLGYGVYLVHIPVADHFLVPIATRLYGEHVSMLWVWPASVVALVGLSLGISYVLHVLVEKPSLHLRDKIAA